MQVRAKFRCYSKQEEKFSDGSVGYTVLLQAVINHAQDPNHENNRYWKYTPAGSISMSTINAQAATEFEQGSEYYVTFEKAAK